MKKKITQFTKTVGDKIKRSIFKMSPAEVANNYINVAGDYEKMLIEEVLTAKPSRYASEVRYYISHPVEMEEEMNRLSSEKANKSSILEHKVK